MFAMHAKCDNIAAMSELEQILYMQTRLTRAYSEKWHKSLADVVGIFNRYSVLEYIESCYGLFHVQGDDANLADIERLLSRKGEAIC